MTTENIGNNEVKITLQITPEELAKALETAYHKGKGKIAIQGFRKGKVPRKIIEKFYGEDYFYLDAVNLVLPDLYEKFLDETDLEIVSQPSFDLEEEITLEKGATVIAIISVKPEVQLKKEDYTGVTYDAVAEEKVTDEEIEREINQLRERNSRIAPVEGRASKNGDIVNINFEGFVDGVAFAGGKSEGFDLKLGSKNFIDTFEAQLEGKEIGEDVDVHVTFPEHYPGNQDLAGAKAHFKVKINDIKEVQLPELDDDFAQDVSEFDTMEEYRTHLKEQIQIMRDENRTGTIQENIVKSIAAKIEIDIPKSMVDAQITNIVEDTANTMRMRGVGLEVYLQHIGQTMDEYRESQRENADEQVRARLLLEKIAELENFEVTDEEFEEEVDRIADVYNMERAKLVEAIGVAGEKGLRTDIKAKKAVDYLTEHAIEKA